jgi:hypothetical protein
MHVGIKVLAQTYCFFIYSKKYLGIFLLKKYITGSYNVS